MTNEHKFKMRSSLHPYKLININTTKKKMKNCIFNYMWTKDIYTDYKSEFQLYLDGRMKFDWVGNS